MPADRGQSSARAEVWRVGLVWLHDSALHVRQVQRKRRPAAVVEQGYAAETGRVVRRQWREGPAPRRQAAPCFLHSAWMARPGRCSGERSGAERTTQMQCDTGCRVTAPYVARRGVLLPSLVTDSIIQHLQTKLRRTDKLLAVQSTSADARPGASSQSLDHSASSLHTAAPWLQFCAMHLAPRLGSAACARHRHACLPGDSQTKPSKAAQCNMQERLQAARAGSAHVSSPVHRSWALRAHSAATFAHRHKDPRARGPLVVFSRLCARAALQPSNGCT